jgi:hypothetical protein
MAFDIGSQKPPMVLFETGLPNPAPSSFADVHSEIFCYNPSQLITNSSALTEAASEHRKKLLYSPNPPKNAAAYGTNHPLGPFIKI